MTWYVGVLKQYAVFRGRARRKEYWMFILVNFLIMSLLGLLLNRTDAFVLTLLASLYPLAILLPWVSVTVRRLHDVGRSGWWALLGLAPIFAPVLPAPISLVTIVMWIALHVFMLLDSQPGENRFGPNPKTAAA